MGPPQKHIGVATNAKAGVEFRFAHYDDKTVLPSYIEAAFAEGFVIVHKGLLCWITLPSAGAVPTNRLLLYALEATTRLPFLGHEVFPGQGLRHGSHVNVGSG